MTSSDFDLDATQYGLDDLEDVLETSFCAQYPDSRSKAESVSSYGLSDLDDDFSDEDIDEEPVKVVEEHKSHKHAPSVEIEDNGGEMLKTQDWAELDTGTAMKSGHKSHTPSVGSVDLAGAGLPTQGLQQLITQPVAPFDAITLKTTRPALDHAQSPARNDPQDTERCKAVGVTQTTLDMEDPLNILEKPWTPRYRISEAKMEAERLLPSQARSFWSYELYRDIDGKQPEVHYCKTLSESEACAKLFIHEPIIGFDMEWRPRYQPGIKTNASLIQLASETHIGLFHIAQHPGKTPRELMAPSLRKVLESPRILKTGVAVINADGKRSKKYFKIEPRGLFELSWLHWQIQDKAPKKLVALAKLTQMYLGLPLSKGPVRCSDWSKPLSPAQLKYGASDAYVGYHLFQIMNGRRLALSEVPPLPTPTDLSLVPTSQASTAPGSTVPKESQRARRPSASATQAPNFPGVQSAVSHDQPSLSADDARIYAALVQKHDGALGGDKMPRHCILRYYSSLQSVLVEIARRRPRSLDELLQIKGVGKVRISKFGHQWLAVVKQHRDQPHNTEQPLDARSKRVFSALCGLRIQLARKSGLDPFAVAPDAVLRLIALEPPRMEVDLLRLNACKELNVEAAKHGVSLLGFIAKHDDRHTVDTAPRSPLKTFTSPQVNSLNNTSEQPSSRALKNSGTLQACEEISESDDDPSFAESAGMTLKRMARARAVQSPPRRQRLLPKF